MARKQKTISTSYCRNRNYSQHFEWTYELNYDVYKCYVNARNIPKIGYMKRMKEEWDSLHPELSHFNPKQLRQQATFVASEGIILDANLANAPPKLPSTPSQLPSTTVNQSSNSSNTLISTESESHITYEKDGSHFGFNIDQSLFTGLQDKFSKFYNEHINKPLEERHYDINNLEKITQDEWQIANHIIELFISSNKITAGLWNVNVIQYCTVLTVLDKNNSLKEDNTKADKHTKPRWLDFHEQKINNIRRKISYISVILQCRDSNTPLTKHQKSINTKLVKWYRNTKHSTLMAKIAELKHELKVTSQFLRNKKLLAQRNSINKKFQLNQKKVFREWRNKKISIKTTPSKADIETFSSSIWTKSSTHNENATWLKTLERNYCKNVTPKDYQINIKTFKEILTSMKNNGAPAPDKINAYAIKKLPSTHTFLVNAFVDAFDNNKPLPNWLVKGKTTKKLPKNQETGIAKNYRPIACLNITYKLYTSLINKFLENHCTTNNIITMEQAGGKKHSWGCADQLLINKIVLDQVKQQRKNLFMMWFDYRKAFDSVPHSWIIKALHLAKVPEKVLNAILRLMELWATKVNLFAEGTNIETESINYLTGILQGDCLSFMLFILSVNPLSFILSLLPGYSIGKRNSSKVNMTHLFFVDDPKTFSKNKNEATLHLDLITRFTNDINMKLGLDKCAYIYIERGKRKSLGTKLTINNIEISELESEDTYKYLGQDENIVFKGELNKQRVMEEYLKRVRKILYSELYSRNKVLAHNIFAIPVLSPTFGILDWAKQELENLDIKTRKILTASGSFHINSDVDRLYCYRKNGGRGLNSIVDTFISRIVSLSLHLKNPGYDNQFLKHVLTHETERLI